MPEPTHRPSFRSDEIDAAVVDQLLEALDKQADMPGIQRLRSWAYDVLAVQAGERALDVGSGTGSEVQRLAELVGDAGEAIGLEPNPGMRAVAVRRADEARSRATYVDGNASALPFESDSFDVVRSERVFQHLVEPEAAAAEIARVLRPGGRVTLIDSDWATTILHPADPEVVRLLTENMFARSANPFCGRKLAGQLVSTGLVVDDIGSQALIQPAEASTGPIVEMMATQAVADGVISDAQATQLRADLTAGSQRGDFHMSVTMFAVLAHKPVG